jgi:hypothetical protein
MALEQLENDKLYHFLLLALVSILPQSSLVIKDGGVLKIDKHKSAMPAREAFRRKVKRMVAEAATEGRIPLVQLGDARQLLFADKTFDCIITSPPYLNNIDYSKVYGLELSLLYLNEATSKQVRGRLVRSFITKSSKPRDYIPPEIADIAARLPIAGEFFADMEQVLKEMQRVLQPGGSAYIVISNSVVYNEHIVADEILGAMGERLGMEAEIAVGAYRIADVKPQRVQTRESVVILRKRQ